MIRYDPPQDYRRNPPELPREKWVDYDAGESEPPRCDIDAIDGVLHHCPDCQRVHLVALECPPEDAPTCDMVIEVV